MVTNSPDSGVADGPAWRNFQLNSAERGKPPSDGLAQVYGLFLGPAERRFQNLSRLLLHGAAVAGGPDG